jgi:membrane fusion protein (multidrug efflux system)
MLLAGLAQQGCMRPSQAETPAAANESDPKVVSEREPVLVRVVPIKVGTIEQKLEVTANVETLDTVDVISERAEPVLEVLVEEGDEVVAGQELAKLRTRVCQLILDDSIVRRDEAMNAFGQTEKDHLRNVNLARGVESPGRLLTERELEVSEQQLLTAKTLYEASKVAVERAQFDLDNCVLRAPISGTISARDISVGDYAAVGARAFQIVDTSAPKAIFYRPQREIGLLNPGQRLVATSEALPGVRIQGEIERISPTVDALSGTVKVTAGLNAGERTMPIGILVKIDLVLAQHDDALLVPKRALLFEGRTPFCYVVREGMAKRMECVPGVEDPDYLEVLPAESGFRAGDQVVIVGADRLADGDPVLLADE